MIFFKSVKPTAFFDALIAKNIDAFVMPDFQFKMVVNAKKEYRNITPLKCVEYSHNWIIAYRKGIPEEDVQKFKGVMLTAHVNKEFAQMKFLFTAMNARCVGVDPKNLKTTKSIVELAEKYGWYKEDQDFIKANYKEQK